MTRILNDSDSLQNVHCFVLPQRVCSLYDERISFNDDVGDIALYLHKKKVARFMFQNVQRSEKDVSATAALVKDRLMFHSFRASMTAQNIVVLFDRRAAAQTESDSLWIFECDDVNSLPELTANHFIGFSFERDSERTRSWLHFGAQQRLRFFPEHVVSIIPRLFVRSAKMNEFTFLKEIYSDRYKHGWSPPLRDEHFDRFYKMLTG